MGAYKQLDHLVGELRSPRAQRMTHSEVEEMIKTEGWELLRRLLQAHVDERSTATVNEAVVGGDGKQRTHERGHKRDLESIFGTVEVKRTGYGGRAEQSLHPVDAELNLPPERYSHTLRRVAAEEGAQNSFDEVVNAINRQTGAHVPKRQVEELVVRAAQDFDQFYQQQQQVGQVQEWGGSDLLIITGDGKGVPMRRQDLREQTRKAADRREPHLEHRRSKGEKPCSKRMGTVAAVYTIAPFVRSPEQIAGELSRSEQALPVVRPRPEDKRVWASVQHPPEEIIGQAFEEAAKRDPGREKTWCALVDGNRTQLKLLKKGAKDHRVDLTIILDLIHVVEYLWKAAWALHSEGDKQAEEWVTQRLLEILRGHSSLVAAGVRRTATMRGLNRKQRAPIDKCADYLLKYRQYLHYGQYLGAGFPIATGVIEGACRYLVKDRMEKTGARWSLEGAEAVLRLRSLRASGDFDDYWRFHLNQEHQRNHANHYADGKVPELNHPPSHSGNRSSLKLVKTRAASS